MRNQILSRCLERYLNKVNLNKVNVLLGLKQTDKLLKYFMTFQLDTLLL